MEALNDITIHPPFPAPAIAGFGVVVLALVFAAYWRARANAHPVRRLLLAMLRCVAVIGLVVVLLRPMRAEPTVRAGERPIFVVAIDQSASMKTPDVDGASRDAAVRKAFDAVFDR